MQKWERVAYDIHAPAVEVEAFLRSHVYRHCSGTALAEIRVRGSGDRFGGWWLRLGSQMESAWPETWGSFGPGERLHIRLLPSLRATMVEMAINQAIAGSASEHEEQETAYNLLNAIAEKWPEVLRELCRQFEADRQRESATQGHTAVGSESCVGGSQYVDLTDDWPSNNTHVVRQYLAPVDAQFLHEHIASGWAEVRYYTYMIAEEPDLYVGPMYTGELAPGDPLPATRPDQYTGSWILVLCWIQTEIPSSQYPFRFRVVTQISTDDSRYSPTKTAAWLILLPQAPGQSLLQLALAPVPDHLKGAFPQAVRIVQEWLSPDLLWTSIQRFVDALDDYQEGASDEPQVDAKSGEGPRSSPRVPHRPRDRERWLRAWPLIVQMREESLDGEGPFSLEDVRDRLLNEMGWGPTTRTIQDLMKAGDAGMLD